MSAQKMQYSRPGGRSLVRRVVVPVLVIVVAVAAVIALGALLPDKPEPELNVDRPVVNVATTVLEPLEEFVDSFTIPAVVEPWATIQIAAEVNAQVARVAAREGELIRPGQPLVYLDRELIEAEYNKDAAQAEYDRRELERLEEAARRGVASEGELDIARTTVRRSEAQLASAKVRLDRTTIYAPTRVHGSQETPDSIGLLNDMQVEVGEFVSPGTPVAELVDISAVKVQVSVPERDVKYIAVGQQATVVVEALYDQSFTGTITFIKATADPRTRTFQTEVRVPNPNLVLRPGMIVRVQLARQRLTDVLMIPLDAVIPLEQGYQVYVVEDGLARQRRVKIGLLRGREAQVLPVGPGEPGYDPAVPSLAAGETLIVRGQRLVGQDQPVRPQPSVAQLLPGSEPAPVGPAVQVETTPPPTPQAEADAL